MGKKLNLQYRERMGQKRKLPRCRHCGKRSRTGDHKSCQVYWDRSQHMSDSFIVSETDFPEWLKSQARYRLGEADRRWKAVLKDQSDLNTETEETANDPSLYERSLF